MSKPVKVLIADSFEPAGVNRLIAAGCEVVHRRDLEDEIRILREQRDARIYELLEGRKLSADLTVNREVVLEFLDGIETASSLRPAEEVFSKRFDPEFTEEGRDASAVLDYVGACIEQPGIATTSPRFMGYIPGGGLFHSALGDLLAAA